MEHEWIIDPDALCIPWTGRIYFEIFAMNCWNRQITAAVCTHASSSTILESLYISAARRLFLLDGIWHHWHVALLTLSAMYILPSTYGDDIEEQDDNDVGEEIEEENDLEMDVAKWVYLDEPQRVLCIAIVANEGTRKIQLMF